MLHFAFILNRRPESELQVFRESLPATSVEAGVQMQWAERKKSLPLSTCIESTCIDFGISLSTIWPKRFLSVAALFLVTLLLCLM